MSYSPSHSVPSHDTASRLQPVLLRASPRLQPLAQGYSLHRAARLSYSPQATARTSVLQCLTCGLREAVAGAGEGDADMSRAGYSATPHLGCYSLLVSGMPTRSPRESWAGYPATAHVGYSPSCMYSTAHHACILQPIMHVGYSPSCM